MMKVSFLIFLVSFVVIISASVSFDRMIENEWENFKVSQGLVINVVAKLFRYSIVLISE